MFNTYNNIAHQIFKNNPIKIYLSECEELLNQFHNDENFLNVFDKLKYSYQVTYQLIGDENFKLLAVQYMQLNPIQTINNKNYGKSFPQFLASLRDISEFNFLQYIAQLDWYWIHENENSDILEVPEGTLRSWSSIQSENDQIHIELSIDDNEYLKIEKIDGETKIVQI